MIARASALGLLGVMLGGCVTTVNVPLARRGEGLPSGNRGQSSSVVFSSPEVAAAMAQTPDWVRPEYARNNSNLAYAQPRALTAIDAWPQVPPPSVTNLRRTTLNLNPQQIIIFTGPRNGRGGRYGNQGFGGGFGGGFSPLYTPRPR